jgi:hypothetical protein
MKGVILMPCNKTISAEGVTNIFFKKVYTRFSLYDKIISDRGPQFESIFAKELARLLGYKVGISMAFHPEMDGETEHVNGQTSFRWSNSYTIPDIIQQEMHLHST